MWVCGTSTETGVKPVEKRGFVVFRLLCYLLSYTSSNSKSKHTIIQKCNMINNNKRYQQYTFTFLFVQFKFFKAI